MMTAKQQKKPSAFTLIEVMVAMAALSIAAIGALSYQYYAATHARIAKAQITVTRTALLLMEDWKSVGGSEDYEPSALGLGFSSFLPQPDGQGYPLPERVYSITVDGITMLIVLNWEDVDYDSVAEVTLRQLTVVTGWIERVDGDINSLLTVVERAANGDVNELNDVLRAFAALTTYVRLDASDG